MYITLQTLFRLLTKRLLFAIKLASKGDSVFDQNILSGVEIKLKENYPTAGFPLSLKTVRISNTIAEVQISSRIKFKQQFHQKHF